MVKPVVTTKKGPGGETIRKVFQKEYFVCDLNLGGDTKMKQTKLSFKIVLRADKRPESAVTSTDKPDSNCNSKNTFSTSTGGTENKTAGQEHGAGINSDDEKGLE